MESTERDLVHKLLFWGTLTLLAHFAVVLCHLWLLVRVEPSTPKLLPPVLILFNLVPLGGLLALREGYLKSARSMIAVPLAIALVVGFWRTLLELRHRQCLSHVAGRVAVVISDQCYAAGVPRSAGLLDWT